jgi:hypothetical protein
MFYSAAVVRGSIGVRATNQGTMADARTVERTARRNSDERWRLWSVSAPGIMDLWACGLRRGVRCYSQREDPSAICPE